MTTPNPQHKGEARTPETEALHKEICGLIADVDLLLKHRGSMTFQGDSLERIGVILRTRAAELSAQPLITPAPSDDDRKLARQALAASKRTGEMPVEQWASELVESMHAQDTELSAQESKPVAWNIELLPVSVDGVPEACKVRLSVGVQHFHVGADYWDTREEGGWYAAQLETAMRRAEVSIPDAVNRFLGWQLPKTFSPDCGVSFKPWPESKPIWPVGTNLFTADETKAMLEYVLAAPVSAQDASPKDGPRGG